MIYQVATTVFPLYKQSVQLWKVQCPVGFFSRNKQLALGTDITGCLFIVFLTEVAVK